MKKSKKYLTKDQANNFLRLVKSEVGFDIHDITRYLHTKKVVPFKSGANLKIHLADGHFKTEWVEHILSLVSKRELSAVEKLKKEIENYL